jgi:hypothetical protein
MVEVPDDEHDMLPSSEDVAEALAYEVGGTVARRWLTDAEIEAMHAESLCRLAEAQQAAAEAVITIPYSEYGALLQDARSWRKYRAPEWVAFREWLADYEHALRIRQASHDIRDHFAAWGHGEGGGDVVGYEELRHRRATPAWVYPCTGVDHCTVCGQRLRTCRQYVTYENEHPARPFDPRCPSHEPGNEKPQYCLEHRPDPAGDAKVPEVAA